MMKVRGTYWKTLVINTIEIFEEAVIFKVFEHFVFLRNFFMVFKVVGDHFGIFEGLHVFVPDLLGPTCPREIKFDYWVGTLHEIRPRFHYLLNYLWVVPQAYVVLLNYIILDNKAFQFYDCSYS